MEERLNFFEARWKNFKNFKDTGWIKIKPITIILGPNNVGKTNFIAPFLLMNQTLTSRDTRTPLILKGDVYDGGSYREIVNDYDSEKDVFFGFRYGTHKTDKELEEVGEYPPGSFEITFGLGEEGNKRMVLKKTTVYDIYLRRFFEISKGKRKGYNYSGLGKNSISKEELKAIRTSIPINFVFSPNSVLYNYDSTEVEDEREQDDDVGFSKGFSNILSALSFNYTMSRKYLGDLSFIGPLREHPRRVYEITNETYNTVGTHGENMANLLNKIGDKQEVLDSWVKKFGFGDCLKMENLDSNLYAIGFGKSNSERYTTIANSGFGASQVLPLMVQALISTEGSLTIAEQPEIHLNPKLQSTLADLFVYMANNNQKIIVESHSEHMMLRLRRLIADKSISADNVAVYFVDQKEEQANIREIKIEDDGHIESHEWPPNFFDDALTESMALANEQFKRNNA